eukprot:TRINITY_DN3129_c0_g1_i1.p1 TRINITY_DN3129_c0_g1~~TRINITY_DN3129_c0_g1_i1.p1  ORF type:complete len:569 (-),score=114.03 TRINITY_DN3129_c0_g1_i1:715-2325(-)
MTSPFQVTDHQPNLSQERDVQSLESLGELQEDMESQPTLFFSVLYELYNRKSTTKDGKRTRRLSKVVSEGGLDEDEQAAPFTWPAVVDSLLELAGDVYITPDNVEPLVQVGEGGFAKVYKSLWKRHGEELVVALKKLKNTNLEPEDLEELIGEANLLRKLDNQYIVKFYGMGSMSTQSLEHMRNSLFLVQEFVGGGTLKHVILQQHQNKAGKTKVYTYQEAFQWLLHIAKALQYLHAQRPIVMHRDLKPENVLLTEGPASQAQAKLVDFGLHKRIKSRVTQKFLGHHSATTGNLTQKVVERKNNPRRFSDDSAEKQNGQRLLEAFLSADIEEKVQKLELGNSSQQVSKGSLSKQLSQISEDQNQQQNKINQEENAPDVNARLTLASTGALHSVRSQASGRAGSHMYMSPETINGDAYSEKVDVYAFGVLAYELLKGELNVVELTKEAKREKWSANEALSRYARRVARGWREPIPKTWPPELVEFIEECWTQDPHDRPKSAEVVNKLETLVQSRAIKRMDKKKSIFSSTISKFVLRK